MYVLLLFSGINGSRDNRILVDDESAEQRISDVIGLEQTNGLPHTLQRISE